MFINASEIQMRHEQHLSRVPVLTFVSIQKDRQTSYSRRLRYGGVCDPAFLLRLFLR